MLFVDFSFNSKPISLKFCTGHFQPSRQFSACDVVSTWVWGWNHFAMFANLNISYFWLRFNKNKRHHYNVVSTSSFKRCWNHVEIMTLIHFSYETFFQRRFNVILPFFNIVTTLKQRCACWKLGKSCLNICKDFAKIYSIFQKLYHFTYAYM